LLLVYPQGSFGQREHLLVILTLPYLLRAAIVAQGGEIDARRSAVIGLVAAIGIGIKPHFAVLPILVEAYLPTRCGLRARLRDPVPWTICIFGVAYVIAVRLIHPAFFSHELPLAMQYYDPGTGWRILAQPESIGVILPLVPFGLSAFAFRRARLAQIVALACLAWLIGACLQQRGWDYHYLPARTAVIMLGITLATALLDHWNTTMPNWPKAALGSGVLVLALFLTGNLSPPFRDQLGFADTPAGHVLPIIRDAARGKPVLWLTTSIYPQFPVLNYTGSVLAMPNESLWLLPSVYADAPAPDGHIRFHAPDAMPEAESELLHATVAMAVRLKPALIITTDSWAEPGYGGRVFDYLDYFEQEPRFHAFFADYQMMTKFGAWTFYQRLPGR
jgi:hypothetical protein